MALSNHGVQLRGRQVGAGGLGVGESRDLGSVVFFALFEAREDDPDPRRGILRRPGDEGVVRLLVVRFPLGQRRERAGACN